jgi:hypothetical protein
MDDEIDVQLSRVVHARAVRITKTEQIDGDNVVCGCEQVERVAHLVCRCCRINAVDE